MQLLSLKIENIRAIQKLDVDLSVTPTTPRRRLVLLGANGAGKSTVLNALAHAFQVVGSTAKDFDAAELTAGDVRSVGEEMPMPDASPPRGAIEFQGWLSPEERRGIEPIFYSPPASGSVRLTIGGGDVEEIMRRMGRRPRTDNQFEDAARAAMLNSRPPCVLLSADRGLLESRDDVMLKDVVDFSPRRGCLSRSRERFFSLAARLALAFAGDKRVDPNGTTLRMWKVLGKYFPDLPKPIGIESLSLRFKTQDGALVALDALSDGQRALLLVFGEIALRTPQYGVVLIDEVEQHLHPRWQRIIPEALSALIPTAQFILTTQSPYLAAAFPDDRFELGDWKSHGE